MKHIFLKMFFTLFSIQYIALGMDLKPECTPIEKKMSIESKVLMNTIVSTIDGALTKTYLPKTNFFGNLSKEDMLGVINMASASFKSITPTEKFISKMYTRNKLFKQAIDHFTELTRKDLNNVTTNTLTVIEHNKCTPQLINLHPTVATCIMKHAYSTLPSHYDMTFSDHSGAIIAYDLCPHTNQAATTGKDKLMSIYSLSQAKQIFFKYEDELIHTVCFNNEGTQLAALVGDSLMKIWNPMTCELLHCISTEHYVYHISYNEYSAKSILSACAILSYSPHKKNTPFKQIQETEFPIDRRDVILQWDITDQDFQSLGILRVSGELPENKSHFTKENYTLIPNYLDRTSFTVRKTGCNSFYLLNKAIQNTKDITSFNTIESLPMYQQDLTDYEKSMIQKEVQNRKHNLIKTLSKTHTSSHRDSRPLLVFTD